MTASVTPAPPSAHALAPTGGNGGDYSYAELSGSPYSAQVLGAPKLGLKRDVYDANLTVTWELSPGVTFTTVNGYRKFNSNEVFDADGGPAWYLEFAEDARGDQYSHEGRFNFTGDTYRASFGWNAFFENNLQRVPFSTEEGTYLGCSVSPAFAAVRAALAANGVSGCVAPNGTVTAAKATAVLTRGAATQIPYQSVFTNYGTNDTYSVFADGTWIPTPRLELTAGARVLIERRKSGYSSVQPNSVILAALGVKTSLLGTPSTGGAIFTAVDSFSAILPRFNALYRVTDNVNLYATISKGRRSPVVQLGAATAGGAVVPSLQIVPDEVVWNYEAGIKGKVGPFSGSLGVFYQDYNGFQVTVLDSAGKSVTKSAGTARNPGIEFEGNLHVNKLIQVFGNFAYVDGKIANDASSGVFAGNQFRLQPKYSASGGVALRVPVENVTFYATPSATYQSKEYFELPNLEAISQGGYTLVNLRAGVELAGGRYQVGGFARNLLNRQYLIDAGNTGGSFGIPTYIRGEPRVYGVEVSGKF